MSKTTSTRVRVVGALLALAAVFLVAQASMAAMSLPTLVGSVGPGYTITLTKNGKPVKTLKAGKYRFVIHDKASIHSFSLDGPHGYAKDFTTIPFVGSKTFTVTLKAGKYKFYCPNHEPVMFGHFTAK